MSHYDNIVHYPLRIGESNGVGLSDDAGDVYDPSQRKLGGSLFVKGEYRIEYSWGGVAGYADAADFRIYDSQRRFVGSANGAGEMFDATGAQIGKTMYTEHHYPDPKRQFGTAAAALLLLFLAD